MTALSHPRLAQRRPVLAELIPASLVRDAGLVVGVAVLTSLCALVSFHIPGTPVPVSGQTFAVLLGAAAVGPLRGVLGQVLYIAVGLAGAPVYAGQTHGWAELTGASGGYIAGFVLASVFIGWQARRGADRRIDSYAGAFLVGSAIIYVPGVLWLMHYANLSFVNAMQGGVYPFLLGDCLKAAAAGVVLPLAWRALRGHRGGEPKLSADGRA